MNKGWVPGALAVIKASKWPRNLNRVVTLICCTEAIDRSGNRKMNWVVSDGNLFDGYDSERFPDIVRLESDRLGIDQWKLRLLEDDEPTEADQEGIIRTLEVA